MKKSNNQFLQKWIGDLSRSQNEAINDLQFCRKTLKSNLQKLYLMLDEIFYYFYVTLYNVFKLYTHQKVHKNLL